MKIHNPEAKAKLIQRLRRIEGQLRGVQSMLEEERDCREILQQLSAVRSAVQGASRTFLHEYATACLNTMEDADGQAAGMDEPARKQAERVRREKLIEDMIDLLDKAP